MWLGSTCSYNNKQLTRYKYPMTYDTEQNLPRSDDFAACASAATVTSSFNVIIIIPGDRVPASAGSLICARVPTKQVLKFVYRLRRTAVYDGNDDSTPDCCSWCFRVWNYSGLPVRSVLGWSRGQRPCTARLVRENDLLRRLCGRPRCLIRRTKWPS